MNLKKISMYGIAMGSLFSIALYASQAQTTDAHTMSPQAYAFLHVYQRYQGNISGRRVSLRALGPVGSNAWRFEVRTPTSAGISVSQIVEFNVQTHELTIEPVAYQQEGSL